MNGGIYTPLVTPLLDQDTLDVGGLERIIEHVIRGGVHGIFLLGTTGEGPSLSARLNLEVIERGARLIAGRLPLLVNVTGAAVTDNLNLARAAADAGAEAVVHAGPLYAPLSQDALAGHLERFAARSPLPLVLYNMPSHTHIFFEVPTVLRLVETAKVIGLKDSSGELIYLQNLRRALGTGFPLFEGPEEILHPAMLVGASGGVNGGSNLFPHIFVGIYNAVKSGNTAEAVRLQQLSLQLSDAVYRSGYLRSLKAALAARGLCGAFIAEPLEPLGGEALARIAEVVHCPEYAPA